MKLVAFCPSIVNMTVTHIKQSLNLTFITLWALEEIRYSKYKVIKFVHILDNIIIGSAVPGLMSEIKDNFIKILDNSQCGITHNMDSLMTLLRNNDSQLHAALTSRNIKPQV